MKLAAACLSLGLALVLVNRAEEKTTVKEIKLPPDDAAAELKPGPGVEAVRAQCAICHSTDYIVRQPGGDAKRWQAEVKKMVTVFGAPTSDADAKVIVEYLASRYGPQAKKSSHSKAARPR